MCVDMADVIMLDMVTRLDIPVERVLENAKDLVKDTVVVIGWDEDGGLYFASSKADGGDVLWLLEKAKQALLEVGG
jgi:hypothetical protein